VRHTADQRQQLIAVERLSQVAIRTRAALQLLGRHLVVCGDEHNGDGGA
jgi:hypothetical protein